MPITEQHRVTRDKFVTLCDSLRGTFYERDDEITVAALAMFSKEHAFFLGVPGTAKSMVIRAIVQSLMGIRYFESALSKTTPTDKIIGPIDLAKLRHTNEYNYKRKGYLTDADVAFLDEIGKMSPVLGHDILALANERIYHEVREDGGAVQSVHQAPLYTMFTASNEELTAESDNAAAMWDRLLLRTMVHPIQDDDKFLDLMFDNMEIPTVEIDWEDLKDVIDNAVPEVTFHPTVREAIRKLRGEFRREGISPSDRRWRWSMKVLKAAAFLDGREEVYEDDLVALQWTLWDTAEQIDKVARLCMACANPFVEPLLELRSAVKEVDASVSERMGVDANGNEQREARQAYGKEAIKKLQTVRDELDTLAMSAQGRKIPKYRDVVDEHRRVLKRVFIDCLEQADEAAELMMAKSRTNPTGRLGQGYADQ